MVPGGEEAFVERGETNEGMLHVLTGRSAEAMSKAWRVHWLAVRGHCVRRHSFGDVNWLRLVVYSPVGSEVCLHACSVVNCVAVKKVFHHLLKVD